MPLIPFTSNYEDNSTEEGFQFTFFCDICREGYKTKFIPSESHKKAGLFRAIGDVVSVGASLAGRYGTEYAAERGADIISRKFEGMSPEWHKEHEAAFEVSQNEAKGNFNRCPKCRRWVCENDWNEQVGLCVEDAPRVGVEVAAARADKMVADIREKASATQVFTGEIESRQTICPQCGKPAGEGKFCTNCGAQLSQIKCPKCGAKNQAGTRFCGECGTKLA